MKRRQGPHDRRPVVDVGLSSGADSTGCGTSAAPQVGPSHALADERLPQTIADLRKQRQRLMAAERPTPLRPYVGRRPAAAANAAATTTFAPTESSDDVRWVSPSTSVATSCDVSDRPTADVTDTSGISNRLDNKRLKKSHADAAVCQGPADVSSCQQNEQISKYLAAVG